jgi:hypothetical protein
MSATPNISNTVNFARIKDGLFSSKPDLRFSYLKMFSTHHIPIITPMLNCGLKSA